MHTSDLNQVPGSLAASRRTTIAFLQENSKYGIHSTQNMAPCTAWRIPTKRIPLNRALVVTLVACALLPIVANGLIVVAAAATAGVTIDFEELPLDAGQLYYNGADGAGGFSSRGAWFNNDFHTTFGSWRGWAYSRDTDTTTPGVGNQYSAFPGSGAGSTEKYAVGFSNDDGGDDGILPEISLPAATEPVALKITNTTYAALSMLHGDSFAKKFGGASGNDPDWFRLRIVGLDYSKSVVGSVETYLADYRFPDSANDYVLDHWEDIDLSSLQAAGVTTLQFRLDSSDVGPFGMNTPAYLAVDDLLLTKASLTGDYDGNGTVDAADYVTWRDALGRQVARPGDGADGNASGVVDAGDHAVWRANFGQTSDGASTIRAAAADTVGQVTTIPEPPSLVLLAAYSVVFIVFRYTHRYYQERSTTA